MGKAASSGRPLRLVPVDESNREAILQLHVRDDQVQLVAPNTKSLRQASEEPSLVPRALLEGERAVGFAMYQRRPDGTAYVWRIMIDGARQGEGLGRRLMALVLEELRRAGHRRVFISHRPQNRAAAGLFESLGFEEHDVEPDGEVVRVLELDP